MLAIASLLDPATDQQTRDLWRFLEEKCGLSGIQTAPFPHFSWLSCEDISWPAADTSLINLASGVAPFKVKMAGLGIFTGKIPILYLSLVKTRELMEIHRNIWKRVEGMLVDPQDYYLPELWVPHITIAHGDLDPNNLGCAIRDLAFEKLAIDIYINNISVIYNKIEGVGVRAKYKLEPK